MLISGPQKIGKSLLASQLALSLAAPEPFLGFEPGENGPAKVLILQAEGSEQSAQGRFRKQVSAFGDGAPDRVSNVCVFSGVKLNSAEGLAEVESLINQWKPDLLVVDPLANFHTGDENVSRDMLTVTTALDKFRQDGIAVALVHHHNKGGAEQRNVGYKARGSSALAGWYDSHLSLEWTISKGRRGFALNSGMPMPPAVFC